MPPHRIEFDEEAEAKFKSLGQHFQIEIAVHLSRLSEDPGGLSRPTATPPHPPGYLVSRFETLLDGRRHDVYIFFHYGDGGVLIIRDFGIVHY